ncbi:MAG: D-tyrosyl-tRNA(Tyr) deacylase [Bacteroidetes bacterium]|jgi:D-tyrosyl-tRNA(Tyr) deacylase|nr:D-tyrosyl-tRNA(Tyr) deacylase [Bacteroidota bacterium]
MRLIVQRASEASVTIEGKQTATISRGFLILAGIEDEDTPEDISWLVSKVCQMRIFSDNEGKMNLDIKQIHGDILLVSQFTLHASTKKGNRPSFIKAARPEKAIPLYEKLITEFNTVLGKIIQTGEFGADMKVTLVNDGPVTIFIDSKIKE